MKNEDKKIMNNSVWISKEAIPKLIAIVEDVLEKIKEDIYEDWDVNDAIILGHFVLPVLKDNIDRGLYSDQLLDKGWMFLRLLAKKHNISISG